MSRIALKLSMTTTAGSSRSTRFVVSLRRGLRSLAPDRRRAQVGEDDVALQEALLEKGELLHVLDELQRRLGQRGEVDGPSRPGAPARRASGGRTASCPRRALRRSMRHRPDGKPATQDAVEGGAARREALQDRPVRAHGCSSRWGEQAPVAKPRDLRETIDHHGPGQVRQQGPELASEIAQCGRRVRGGVVPAGRDAVEVVEALPRDGERAQLRPAGRRALRRAPHERGRGGGAEDVRERLPEEGEEMACGGMGPAPPASGIRRREPLRPRHLLPVERRSNGAPITGEDRASTAISTPSPPGPCRTRTRGL